MSRQVDRARAKKNRGAHGQRYAMDTRQVCRPDRLKPLKRRRHQANDHVVGKYADGHVIELLRDVQC